MAMAKKSAKNFKLDNRSLSGVAFSPIVLNTRTTKIPMSLNRVTKGSPNAG